MAVTRGKRPGMGTRGGESQFRQINPTATGTGGWVPLEEDPSTDGDPDAGRCANCDRAIAHRKSYTQCPACNSDNFEGQERG